jgi:outer membrane protein TolC
MTSPIEDRTKQSCTNERPVARRRVSLLTAGLVALAALVVAPRSASALQPLAEFLESAKTRSPDNKEAAATIDQRSGETDQAWGRVLPGFTARGVYTRNQYEAAIPFLGPAGPEAADGSFDRVAFGEPTTITPKNQWDAFLTLDIPIIDVGGWSRVSASKAITEATKERARATGDEVSRAVAQRYYQLVAVEALVDSANRSLQASEESSRIADIRKQAGAATELDVQRALAEVERTRQALADAEFQRAISLRGLESLSGLKPTGGAPALVDDLRAEAPLESWGGADVSPLPAVRAAELERKAASRTAFAAKAALIPTVAAQATERFSNSGGFTGKDVSYVATVTATWHIDWATVGGIRAGDAAQVAADARQEKTQLAARDRIHDAWHQVQAQIAKSRAARAQAKALQVAAAIAKDRYESGVGTQLELIQAERDAFNADVARISADGDLLYARTLLRIGAGRPLQPLVGGGSGTPALPSTAPNTDPNAPTGAAPGPPGAPAPAAPPAPGVPAPLPGSPSPAPGGPAPK